MRDITFKSFSVKNFLSIGNDPVDLTFVPGVHIITGHNKDKDGRRNGVGKSTVMDAMHWVLFGSPLREINKDTIANFNTKGTCQGVIEFDIVLNGKKNTYKIVRKLSPSKCELFVNEEDKTLSTTPKTNELITNLLGFNSTLFKNSVILSINNTQPFLAQDKITKRKFVEGVFNLEVFSNILSDVRTRSIEIKKQIDITITKIDSRKQNVTVYAAQRDLFEVQRKKNIDDTQKDIEIIDAKVKELVTKIVDTAELETKQTNLKDRKRQIAELIKKTESEVNTLKEESWKATQRIDRTRNDKKNLLSLEEMLKTLQLDYQSFDGKVVDATPYKEGIELQKKRKTEAQSQIAKIRTDKTAYTETVWQLKSNLTTLQKEKTAYIDSAKQTCCPTCKRPFDVKVVIEQSRIDDFDNRILVENNSIAACNNNLKTDYDDKIVILEVAIQKADDDIVKLTSLIGNIEKTIAAKDTVFKQFTSVSEKIKTSPTKEVLDEQIQKDSDIITANDTKSSTLNGTIKKLQVDGIEKIDFELDKIQAKIQENNKYKSDLEHNQNLIKDYNKRIDSFNAQPNTFIELLENAKSDLALIESELVEQNKIYAIYESAKYIVSEEGVKTYIIKKLLAALNSRIEYYLRKLDANSTCVFNEFFEETIKNDKGIECSYFNFSGAEMKTIDLACLFAFADIRRLQGDVSINFSMYDELFDSSFDERGLELVTEILKNRVEDNNEAVFIISHRKDAIKSISGETIILEKKNGITKRIS